MVVVPVIPALRQEDSSSRPTWSRFETSLSETPKTLSQNQSVKTMANQRPTDTSLQRVNKEEKRQWPFHLGNQGRLSWRGDASAKPDIWEYFISKKERCPSMTAVSFCYGWMFWVPKGSCAKSLALSVVVFRGGTPFRGGTRGSNTRSICLACPKVLGLNPSTEIKKVDYCLLIGT